MKGLWLLALVVPLTGCAVGYDSLLMVARSNVGLDADTKPPTLQLSIARQEGVVEPGLEGGRTLPVMSSFKAPVEVGPLERLAFGVSTTFATGEAAEYLGRFHGDPTPARPPGYDGEVLKNRPTRMVLTTVPWIDGLLCDLLGLNELICRQEPIGTDDGRVRPLVFATDTVFGLKVEWTGETAQYPSSVKFGFNRKEAAWTPVSYTTRGEGARQKTVARSPSVLAVLDNYNSIGGPPTGVAPAAGGTPAAGAPTSVGYLQYFATGAAASRLALRQEVRQAMLRRLEPEIPMEVVEHAGDVAARRLRCWLLGSKDSAERAARRKEMQACLPAGEKVRVVDLLSDAKYATARDACIAMLGDKVVCPDASTDAEEED